MLYSLAFWACAAEPTPPPPTPSVPAVIAPASWALRAADGVPGAPVDAAARFALVAVPTARVNVDPVALAATAKDTLRYLDAHAVDDPVGVSAGLFGDLGVSLDRVRATLAWVVSVAEEDARTGKNRLADSAFLEKHLELWSWKPDVEAAAKRGVKLDPDKIRLTRYLAWRFDGSPERAPGFDGGLYSVPSDEAQLSDKEVDGRTDLLRFKYTRAQVLDGVYETGEAAGKARAIAWLPRSKVHDALLQGTAVVRFPDGSEHTLNVHRNNGKVWRPELAKTPERQDCLWYFREVDGLLGWGRDDKVRVQAGVTVAGDIANIGLGKLILLYWDTPAGPAARLAVLADSGGAFAPNLFQLDWLAGTFAEKSVFEEAVRPIPERVRAGIVVLKLGGS